MSSILITGDTSGTTTLAAPAIAGTNTVTLPAATGFVLVSTGVNASATSNVVSAKVAVNINGTVYYLLASTNNT
jgi:hypothetical protein